MSKIWKYSPSEPSNEWLVDNVPANAESYHINYVIDSEGVKRIPDEVHNSDGTISLFFGFDAISGTAYGEYWEKASSIVSDAGVVNITVNQGVGSPQ